MKIDDFTRFITPELPACPTQLIAQEAILTAIDFCTKTLAWVETQDPIPLQDGVNEYDVDVPTGARAIAAVQVLLNGRPLRPVTQSQLESYMQNWAVAVSIEPLCYNAPTQRDIIRVYPMPQNPTSSIVIKGTYAPTMQSTNIPDFIITDHFDCFAAGVKARLMSKIGTQWSNPLGAAQYQSEYEIKRADARIEVEHDRVPSMIRARPQRFG